VVANKNKIINDPVYGFVTIPTNLIFDIIEEPVFQRLRRIKQLGLTDFVYPGALHTRFQHAIGAMHLMSKALSSLRKKGNIISNDEMEATQIAILLHDIGHGPFSHTLEASILTGVNHEEISLLLMKNLNIKFDGALDLALKIFNNTYHRHFFHQLVSSQLDVDRLDYLQRDCFFTGVSEGAIGAERIIQMLAISNDNIVVEEKGIYSVENFLNSRRFMYWQVYLHKTTVSAEIMLIQIIKRAKDLIHKGESVFATPSLMTFLSQDITIDTFKNNSDIINSFILLDDYDIWTSIKLWIDHPDKVLSILSKMILFRKIFKVILSIEEPSEETIQLYEKQVAQYYNLNDEEIKYFVLNGFITNAAYLAGNESINVISKKGEVSDITLASDLPNIKAMSKIVKKFYLCWPRELIL